MPDALYVSYLMIAPNFIFFRYTITTPAVGPGKQCLFPAGTEMNRSCTWGECVSCLGKTCNNQGTCSSLTGQCVCNSGFTGSNCEIENSQCSLTKCNGHGNCDSSGGCTCTAGWMSEGEIGNSEGVYCTSDPCYGCPSGQCDATTGFCACLGGLQQSKNRVAGSLACGQLIGGGDCQGSFGSWGSCGTDCTQKRYYTITNPASSGGAACSHNVGDSESQKCSSGLCCSLAASACQNGATFLASQCQCLCSPGWQGPTCSVSKDDSSAVVTKETQATAAQMGAIVTSTTVAPVANTTSTGSAEGSSSSSMSMPMIGGIGGGVLALLIGGYMMFAKKKEPVDPLAALGEVEGMEDLDMGALGLDDSALTQGGDGVTL